MGASLGSGVKLGQITQYTIDREWLETITNSNARYIQIRTTASPSWVGWREIQINTSVAGPAPQTGSIPAALAGPADHAFYLGSGTSSTFNPGSSTTTYADLDLLGSSVYTLGPNDTLNLDNGNGTLFVGPGAVFIGNGIVNGNILNSGLVSIPITRLGSYSFTAPPPSSPGGTVIVPQPVILPPPGEKIPVPPPVDGNFTPSPSSGFFLGYPSSGGGGYTGGTTVYRIDNGPSNPVVIQGTLATDASLEVTGDFVQTATGALRLFIAGTEQGTEYSLLDVGGSIELNGTLQIVLKPELFGYLPSNGQFFDMILSDQGITLANDLRLDALISAQAGSSYLAALGFSSLPAHTSPFLGDPDQLLDLPDDYFQYALIDNGHILRITYTAVPEPSSICIIGACIVAGGYSMFRKKSRNTIFKVSI